MRQSSAVSLQIRKSTNGRRTHQNIKIICYNFNKSWRKLRRVRGGAPIQPKGRSHRCDCTPNERAIFHEYFYPVYWPPASQTVGWILIIRLLRLGILFLPRMKARKGGCQRGWTEKREGRGARIRVLSLLLLNRLSQRTFFSYKEFGVRQAIWHCIFN